MDSKPIPSDAKDRLEVTATLALVGLLSSPITRGPAVTAGQAIVYAKELIKALDKEPGT